MTTTLTLKKGEDRRIRAGHPWIFSNEIATHMTPFKSFKPGEEVVVTAYDHTLLGKAYVNPHSLITARLFSQNPEAHLDLDFFVQKLQLALDTRARFFAKPYYRLVFSEADQLPGLVIDRFGYHLVIQINTAGMEAQKETIITALLAVLPETQSILMRNDSPIRQQEGLQTYVEPVHGQVPETIIIEENGVEFNIPLMKGQKTGWFYDHRDNRARLQKYVQGRTVLDVFSYLGGFGIQAAVFGASQIDCIDASATACDFIAQNAQLNHVEHKVRTLNDDAFDAMKVLLRMNKTYDVIILDPPAFVKKNKDRKEGTIAYQRINELALKLLSPNGILVSCSCSMHIGMSDLMKIVQQAATKSQKTIQVLERGHQGLDHPLHAAIPETDYLKAIVVKLIS